MNHARPGPLLVSVELALTPALTPGRESPIPRRSRGTTIGRTTNPGEQDPNRSTRLPLPPGEGRGEGRRAGHLRGGRLRIARSKAAASHRTPDEPAFHANRRSEAS